MHGTELICDLEGVATIAEAVRCAEHLGLDSESNSMFAYHERVCLVQLSVDDRRIIIDPLALPRGEQALAPLKGLLEDPQRPVVVHGGEYDVAVFKREFGIALRGIFDTQQAASFLGWKRTGLSSLVEEICGEKLSKAFARHNWSRRPLENRALAYAVGDVAHLRALRTRLSDDVERADLTEELELANRAVEEVPEHRKVFDPAGFWKLKGVKGLDAQARLRVQALYAWREALAERVDRPPGLLFNNRVLVTIAERPPHNDAGLRGTELQPQFRRKHGSALLSILHAASTQEPIPAPQAKERTRNRVHAQRCKALEAWRVEESARRGVPLQVVLPRKALDWLAEHHEDVWRDAPQLGTKRLRMYADQWRALFR